MQGEGKRYLRTDSHFYPARQVLCVLEVKKTLASTSLAEGVMHLAEIQRHCIDDVKARCFSETFDLRFAQRAYEQLSGQIAPTNLHAAHNLPEPDRITFFTLFRQTFAPATVLLGFNGYATESGLRSGMHSLIRSDEGSTWKLNFPEVLPTLITAGRFSLIKCTAQPYLLRAPNEGWCLQASSRANVARILIEILWTKISAICAVQMPFGLDLENENLAEHLLVKGKSIDGRGGFNVRRIERSEKELDRPALVDWEPKCLSAASIDVARHFGLERANIELEASLAESIMLKHGVAFDDAVAELVNAHVYCRSETEVRPVRPGTYIFLLKDGSGYADPDPSRLIAWCKKMNVEVTSKHPIRVPLE